MSTVYRAFGELIQRIDDTAAKVRQSAEEQERAARREAERRDFVEGGPLRRHLSRMLEQHRVQLSVQAYERRRREKG